MVVYEDYSGRIKEIRAHFKMNKAEFAVLTKTHASILSEYESKNREPSKEFIKTLNEIGISVDWFLTGNGSMLLKPQNRLTSRKTFDDEPIDRLNSNLPDTAAGGKMKPTSGKGGPPGASDTEAVKGNTIAALGKTDASVEALREIARQEIPVVVDGGVEQGLLIPVIAQGLSAGLGIDYDEGETIRYIKVPAWVARNGRDLVALPIYGDSMEPTISNGDLVVCDSGGFCGDGLYMLRDEDRGLMFCKRVVWAPGGWTIKSDNPSYEPVKVDDHVIHIVARILATIKGAK